MKKGLIMEGGAMRGMFTCGVIDVFMEEQIEFDGAAGISAGAVFGGNYKSRQIGRGIRYNKAYCKDPRYCSFRSLLKTGDLYGVDFCYNELPNVLDPFDRETFQANPMEFYCGATDVHTGKAIYHLCRTGDETDVKWMQASASMPLVSQVVKIGERELLDGGIADSVPYWFMKSHGYDRNVLILTQPKGYRKKKSRAGSVMKLLLRKYPAIQKGMALRYKRYNRQMDAIDRDEQLGKILVIRPETSLGIHRTENDPEKLETAYQLGRKEAMKRLNEVKAFLKQ